VPAPWDRPGLPRPALQATDFAGLAMNWSPLFAGVVIIPLRPRRAP